MTRDCDVAVVGGGPAGMAAATSAAESGARVLLLDRSERAGGQVWRHRSGDPPRAARARLERLAASGAQWLGGCAVVDGNAGSLVVVRGAESFTVRWRSLVLATGARELFLPFPGWTLPNVMGAGGAEALLTGGLSVHRKRVIVAGSGPLLLPVAAAMRRAGARLVMVAEQASGASLVAFAVSLLASPGKLARGAAYRAAFAGVRYRTATWVARADGTGCVERVTLTDGARTWTEPCDLLCCAYGLVPETRLAQLLGCTVERGAVVVDALQRTSVAGILCAGEAAGVAGDAAALVQGEIAGLAAAGRPEDAGSRRLRRLRESNRRFAARLARAFEPRAELRELADDATVFCRCEDVRRAQLDPAWSARQARLYTRLGMGPCQGAVCGPACALLFGWEPPGGRPPLEPAPIGALAQAERDSS